eukprot:15485515-Alexandrium_andersonii.AAC.1
MNRSYTQGRSVRTAGNTPSQSKGGAHCEQWAPLLTYPLRNQGGIRGHVHRVPIEPSNESNRSKR